MVELSADNWEFGALSAGVPILGPVKLAEYSLPAGRDIEVTRIMPCNGPTGMDWLKNAKEIMKQQNVNPFVGCHLFDKHIRFVQEHASDKKNLHHREIGCKIVNALLSGRRRRVP